MSKKDTPVNRNPVAKNAPEFCKPKTFRDRKKDYTRKQKYEDHERNHPLHKPYKRDHHNYLIEDEEDYGMWGTECVDDPWCPLCNGFDPDCVNKEMDEPEA